MQHHQINGSAPTISMAMLLLPAFNSLACNAFLDPFRAANYLQESPLYRWDFVSANGGSVSASNGMEIGSTQAWSGGQRHDYIVINASWTPEKYQQKSLQRALRKAARAGARLIALDTGAFVLAYAGLLDKYSAVVHREHRDAFVELFSDIHLASDNYVMDRDRISCVGGFASADLALELIRHHHGVELACESARYLYKNNRRSVDDAEAMAHVESVGGALPEVLREAVMLMQRNLEEPLRISDVAHYCGYSTRQLTRLFKQFTGITPVRYYLDLRLQRARGLLTQTERTIAEIASACGFNASEQFSKCYKQRYLVPPSKDRVIGRIPFHYRSNAATD